MNEKEQKVVARYQEQGMIQMITNPSLKIQQLFLNAGSMSRWSPNATKFTTDKPEDRPAHSAPRDIGTCVTENKYIIIY